MRSTFVGSSVPTFPGVMRNRPAPSWSLAINRPLSSDVRQTHEPRSYFAARSRWYHVVLLGYRGTVNSFSTLNPGSVTNVFAGTRDPPCATADASNTFPHGLSP